MRGVASLVVLCGGCETFFPLTLDAAGAGDDDANPIVLSCALVSENYDAVTGGCGNGFGDPGGGSIGRNNGHLILAPAPGSGSDTSCTYANYAFSAGVAIEILNPLETGGTYTLIKIHDDLGKHFVALSILRDQISELEFAEEDVPSNRVKLSYNPMAMRWLQLRPDASNHVVGEFSADGIVWQPLGTTTVTFAPATTNVSLDAGTFANIAAPGKAELDNLNCAPTM